MYTRTMKCSHPRMLVISLIMFITRCYSASEITISGENDANVSGTYKRLESALEPHDSNDRGPDHFQKYTRKFCCKKAFEDYHLVWDKLPDPSFHHYGNVWCIVSPTRKLPLYFAHGGPHDPPTSGY